MSVKLFAAPMSIQQMYLVERVLSGIAPQNPEDDNEARRILETVKILTEQVPLPKNMYLDVLGWNPRLAQWVHLFTWRNYSVSHALLQAENDNSRFGADFTHFCIIPVPSEETTA